MHKIDIPDEVRERVIKRLGRLHVIESLVPAKTALLVVDMQNYFMADGQFGCCPVARDIVPNVNRLAQALRANLKRRKAPLRPAAAPSAGPDAPRERGEGAEDN